MLSGRVAAIAGPNSAKSASISKLEISHGKIAYFICISSGTSFLRFF
jgi:hypothetical protein